MNYKVIDKCKVCYQNNTLVKVLSLPATPPANEFVEKEIEQEKYPLDLMECNKCGFVQLSVQVDPSILFKNYVYVSGTSQVFINHFKDYAKSMVEQFELKKTYYTPKVLDIGSNDGTLLKAFKEYGLDVIGVDPAENIAKKANQDGIFTIPKFLDDSVCFEILQKYGYLDLITANNVFAHNSDLWAFLTHVKNMLTDDGVFVFECAYIVDMIKNISFDQIYSEHYYTHSISALMELFRIHNLRMFNIEKVNTHGGSIRVYVCNENAKHKDKVLLKSFVEEEVNLGLKASKWILDKYNLKLSNKNIFKEYSDKIDLLKNKLKSKLLELKSENKRVVGFGAPAKFCTLSHAFGITKDLIEVIIDDSKLKQNLLTPGNHIPVVSSKYLKENDIDYVVVFAWNFADSIIKNNSEYKGKWIVPIPEFKIV